MTAFEWGSPYSMVRRDSVDPSTEEMVHGKRYELVYDFETKEPLSLRQANEVFGQILAKPEIEEGTKIKFCRIEQSSTEGRMYLQFESKHPFPLAIIVAVCIAAVIIAAAVALIGFIVPPFLAAGYTLATGIAGIPPILKVVLGIAFIGGVVYFGYKLTGKYIEKRMEVPSAPPPGIPPSVNGRELGFFIGENGRPILGPA